MIRTLSFVSILLAAGPALAQDLKLPAPSPRAEVMQTVGVVEVRVNYASPGKKDRTVWGELVPYGELWRTGANAATTLETSGDITVGGQAVPAGKYALFTIPGENEWTVILNKNPDQGGTGTYDKGLDQARFTVAPEKGPARERLTFLFTDTTDAATSLDLTWDGVRVPIAITADTGAAVKGQIDAFVGKAGSTFASAARYEAENGNVARGLELIEHSLAVEKTWYNTWLKAWMLHEQGGNAKLAHKLATEALALGNASKSFFWKDRVEKAVAEWPKK